MAARQCRLWDRFSYLRSDRVVGQYWLEAAASRLDPIDYSGLREKVRTQFLSLRQQVIDITERIVVPAIRATFPAVSVRIRESFQLRARITPHFSDQRAQFSERHFVSAVLVTMMGAMTQMRGDLLALKVALAPCVIGYAEIATRLASRPDAHAATNPYRVWM
jgi:hypothetical protein